LPAIPGIVDAHSAAEVAARRSNTPDRPELRGSALPQCEHGRHQHQCQPQLVGAGVPSSGPIRLGNPVLSRPYRTPYIKSIAECACKHAVFPPRWRRAAQVVPPHAQHVATFIATRCHQLKPEQYSRFLTSLPRAGRDLARRCAADIKQGHH